ncbi:uncharacterized protein LOC123565864 isoform X2 [Mercenaria mercenaria]|uniref:uncharacterized protein LOC123565864 isoform X2 n=1 Tax=Mercenaria mercenaria TaxID=6596 RepID=UPI00234F3D2D|nr:uncharacterized protein LOC123565864 isoform X2 [Mercenaria mercenaria]
MDELHRELLKKRRPYLQENVIMENGLLMKLKEKGLFSNTMIAIIQGESDPEIQMNRMLDMIPKRGPEAFNKFLECLEDDYPWVVKNFKEKEIELINFNARANSDVNPEIRRAVKEYIRELARTTRLNLAQQRAMEDFLCRHITIDTNLNNVKLPGHKLYNIHKQLLSVIPLTVFDESDQMDLKATLPENVSIDKIEKEVKHLIDRVHELEALIETCYEKIGESDRTVDLPDLVHTQRRLLLQKEIEIQELKNQVSTQMRRMRLTVDKARKAQEANQKNEEEKEELEKSLDTLKTKIQKLQEERQKMAMKMAFDGNSSIGPATSTAPSSPRSKSSSRRQSERLPTRALES